VSKKLKVRPESCGEWSVYITIQCAAAAAASPPPPRWPGRPPDSALGRRGGGGVGPGRRARALSLAAKYPTRRAIDSPSYSAPGISAS
jgi:hypothetical protein